MTLVGVELEVYASQMMALAGVELETLVSEPDALTTLPRRTRNFCFRARRADLLISYA